MSFKLSTMPHLALSAKAKRLLKKLIEKTSMTDISRQLSISASTVIQLSDFHFKHDFLNFPRCVLGWYAFHLLSWRSSDSLNIVTVLSALNTIYHQNHFLRYDEAVLRCLVPTHNLAKQLLL